ncbi:AAA family ATPase [Hydrogenoanaerobacterium saccharovorans]|uniref:Nuclease SbcCD subunit C n=1 Tax=Hydrogenoanaerobacterium saccharovorans TaxID=474960 RepID=A0ABS2GQ77_9FIRM|nr:AAA family ATPase [Hydrogenoanaerobacterium saccharovorans]MBM6923756.1 AAA family ATPase [Hydrogenoanaerobacterium saccharovorans]
MRIKNIQLCNFGSYVGQNNFDFQCDSPEQRVVVIGGKNGAGKTTLFTAIQVCLYGNFAFGYKTTGKHYLREIYNLINNQIRIDDQETAFVEVEFQQVDNTDLYNYVIRRSWSWPHSELKETLSVWQNGERLEDEELLNFQKYLIHLIPPDMLKLYFFDGEKIANYFLGEKEVNIRDALMVLSGNDTFDILYDQIKRILKNSENVQTDIAKDYLVARNESVALQNQLSDMQREIDCYQAEIDEIESEISRCQKEYVDRGGVTIDEWKNLNNQLKDEEEKRERLNWQRRTYATEVVPFLMLPDLMKEVLPQLQLEKDHQGYSVLKNSIEDNAFSDLLKNALCEIGSTNVEQDFSTLSQKIKEYFLSKKWEMFEPLFGLSSDEEAQIQTQVNHILAFDIKQIPRNQKRIQESLKKTKEIRTRLQATTIENYESYMNLRSSLEERAKIVRLKKEHAETLFELRSADREKKEKELHTLRREFEDQLKARSISDISGKTLLLLEELQEMLYSNLIKQVETDLNLKFKQLIRKKDFFSQMVIDRNFVVHMLRQETVSRTDLLSLFRGGNQNIAVNVLGKVAVEELFSQYQVGTISELFHALAEEKAENLTLSVELDKERLSSGEKQIFVMALYWAMMNQSKSELPFIIDTPFARIDTEHRANITEHFFKQLTGQLIILSTDEELSSNHLEAMQDQISHIYMLEYGPDQKTHIHKNQYFEV